MKDKLLFILFLALCNFCVMFGQVKNVSGVVKDASGEPLIGVNVHIKEMPQNGVITGIDGDYKLSKVNSQQTLVFSYIGMKTKEVKITSKSIINVVLESDTKVLDEVVVVGYGTQKKVSVTGSISTVDNKSVRQSPSPNLVGALAGKLPGLTALQGSSQPGNEDFEIYLRGASTLNGETNPLILVDGVPRDNITMIDPNEVESISILKDASATAVFGVRGANGVIMVTTRTGSTDKPQLNVSAEYGIQSFTTDYTPINSWEYAQAYNEALRNDNKPELYSERQIQLYKDGSSPYYPNTNWMKVMFKNSSPQQRYNVNLTGGTDRVKYFINLGLLNQGGMLNTESKDKLGYDAGYKLNRYNFRSNLDINVTKSIKASVKLAGYIDHVNTPHFGDTRWAVQYNFLGQIMSIPSIVPGPFVTDQMAEEYNLVPGTLLATDNDESAYGKVNYQGFARMDKSKLNSTLSLDFDLNKLLKGLTTNLQVSFDTDNNTTVDGYFDNGYQKGAYNLYNFKLQTEKNEDGSEKDLISFTPRYEFSNHCIDTHKSYSFAYTINAQWRINYNRIFNKKHSVGAMFLAQRDNKEIASGNSIQLMPYNVLGVAGRATYAYDNKYLAEFNIGYNGSEQFAKGKRFGTFPAFSLGWVVSNESFMKDLVDKGILTNLKLRASYGKVGSDKLGNDRFLYLDNNTITTGGVNSTLGEGKTVKQVLIGNPGVTWEIAHKQNYGLDFSLLNNSLLFSFDYFNEKRENILITRNSVPTMIGLPSSVIPKENMGRVDNHGYEIEVTYRKKINKDLSFTTKLAYSYNKNKVIENDELYKGDDYYCPLRGEGYSIGQNFGYLIDWNSPGKGYFLSQEEIDNYTPYEGVKPRVGDFVYKNLNGDDVINDKDVAPIGKPTIPRSNYSFVFNVTYKNFDLSGTIQGLGNSSIYYSAYGIFPSITGSNNYQKIHLHAFTLDRFNNGEKIEFPALSTLSSNSSLTKNDFFIANRRFIRIKNLEIGYTLPKKLLKSIGIKQCRVYSNAQNLFTFTNLPFKQIDPEQKSSNSVLPLIRTINFGLNVKF